MPLCQVRGTQPGVCVQVARSHRAAAILLGNVRSVFGPTDAWYEALSADANQGWKKVWEGRACR